MGKSRDARLQSRAFHAQCHLLTAGILKPAADKGFSHARLLTHVLDEEYKRKRQTPANSGSSMPASPSRWSSRPILSSASPSSTKRRSWPSTTPWAI